MKWYLGKMIHNTTDINEFPVSNIFIDEWELVGRELLYILPTPLCFFLLLFFFSNCLRSQASLRSQACLRSQAVCLSIVCFDCPLCSYRSPARPTLPDGHLFAAACMSTVPFATTLLCSLVVVFPQRLHCILLLSGKLLPPSVFLFFFCFMGPSQNHSPSIYIYIYNLWASWSRSWWWIGWLFP